MTSQENTHQPDWQIEKKTSRLEWLRQQQLKIALGGVAVSTALTVSTDFEQAKDRIIEAAPWIGASLASSEVAWIGGAAMMLAGIGSKIGNPLKMRSRMDEIAAKANDSRLFKAGFAINATAAVAQAGILTEGVVVNLPPESLGYLGIPLMDLSSTLVIRNKIWKGIRRHRNSSALENDNIEDEGSSGEATLEDVNERARQPKVSVRKAHFDDVERLAEIDLARYKKVYGKNPPSKQEVVGMLSKRMKNTTSDWMYVCEVSGEVEGFVTAFRTNKPMEEFISWEDSTADGTLEGKVEPEGKYVYITNLTINRRATKLGGEYVLMANMMAQGIQEGIDYGYFASRMPLFSTWLKRQIKQGNIDGDLSPTDLNELAKQYVAIRETKNDKEVRKDYELRMYEEAGFVMGPVIRDAFEDPQSMNYGVLFKVDVPPRGALKKSKAVRYSLAKSLRLAAKNPKLLERFF